MVDEQQNYSDNKCFLRWNNTTVSVCLLRVRTIILSGFKFSMKEALANILLSNTQEILEGEFMHLLLKRGTKFENWLHSELHANYRATLEECQRPMLKKVNKILNYNTRDATSGI